MIPSTNCIRDNFPAWTQGQCRAYRHGIMAVEEGNEIENDPGLSRFFYYGAADALGEEAEAQDWFGIIAGDWRITAKWWETETEE